MPLAIAPEAVGQDRQLSWQTDEASIQTVRGFVKECGPSRFIGAGIILFFQK